MSVNTPSRVHGEQRLTRRDLLTRRPFGQLPADHGPDQVARDQALELPAEHLPAVAHHGDPLAQREDLFQPVRDEQHGGARGAQRPHHVEEPVHLGGRERGGRLVHHDDPRLQRDGLADLDDLLVRDGQPAGDPRRIERDPEPGEYRRRLRPHGPPVDTPGGTQGLAADEHVLRHGQVGEQRRLLVDDRDPGRERRCRPVQRDLLAVGQQRPRVRLVHAREDLDQRGLARAVLADQGVRLPGVQLDRPID
jgi:hypothetical protein